MTDLLTPASTRQRVPPPRGATEATPGRPLWLNAAFAGVVAAGAVLMCCMALGLVGWFASDAGAHGDTRDAIRVGAAAWLLALGAHLDLATAVITVVPLGLTAFSGYVAFRLGRWASLTSADRDPVSAGLGTVVLAGVYAVVALLAAVLASTEAAELSLGRAFLGGLLVGLLGGGTGILAGSPAADVLRSRVPEGVRAVVAGAVSAALLLLAAGAALVVTGLLLDLGSAANVLARLHPDGAGGALYAAVVAAVAPNAALLGGAYLLGPGFAVGTGTMVAPSGVVLGPVPAFPLLAAVPDPGPGPAWAGALMATPVLLAALAAGLTVRKHPDGGFEVGALRGLAVGVAGGLLSALLVALAGGSVGPGRMADLGAPFAETLGVAVLAMGVGGLVGGVAMTWRVRGGAHGPGATQADPGPGDAEDTEDTVRL